MLNGTQRKIKLAEDVRTYVSEHLHEKVKVSDLAARFHVSETLLKDSIR